jgi:glutamine synthetase
VEASKGECNLGQHEVAFRYADALTTCDHHTLHRTGAEEIAAREGRSTTFMAKPDEREGNSCHIHILLRGEDGEPVHAGDGPYGLSRLGEGFLAGQSLPSASSACSSRPPSTPTSATSPAVSPRPP